MSKFKGVGASTDKEAELNLLRDIMKVKKVAPNTSKQPPVPIGNNIMSMKVVKIVKMSAASKNSVIPPAQMQSIQKWSQTTTAGTSSDRSDNNGTNCTPNTYKNLNIQKHSSQTLSVPLDKSNIRHAQKNIVDDSDGMRHTKSVRTYPNIQKGQVKTHSPQSDNDCTSRTQINSTNVNKHQSTTSLLRSNSRLQPPSAGFPQNNPSTTRSKTSANNSDGLAIPTTLLLAIEKSIREAVTEAKNDLKV